MNARWCWPAACVCCAVLGSLSLVVLHQRGLSSMLSAEAPETGEQSRRGEALKARRTALFNRSQARQVIVGDVLAGRMTVAQAVVEFTDLNQRWPECMTALRLTRPGDSDKQCVRWQVWQHLDRALKEQPVGAREIRQRLEAEQIGSEEGADAGSLSKAGLR